MNLQFDILNIKYIIFIVGLFFIFFIINYYHLLKHRFSNIRNITIILIFRVVVLFAIIIFLLNPIFTKIEYNNKVIDIYVDNSQSMQYNFKDINSDFSTLHNRLNKWSKKNNYSLKYHIFGNKYKKIHSDINKIDFNDNFTNFDIFYDNFTTDVILVSDGVANNGLIEIPSLNHNINIIGIGNEKLLSVDLSISNLDYTIISKDTIELEIVINTLINKNLFNQGIYLSNALNDKIKLGSFNQISDSFQKSINIKAGLDLFANHNIVFIEEYENEKNYENNYLALKISQNLIQNNKIAFISGSISNNTKYIKNKILSNLYNYTITHFYRAGSSWNKELNNFVLDDYDMIVLDNFPDVQLDNKFLLDILKMKNIDILYFLGPGDLLKENDILNYCNCEVINSPSVTNINESMKINFKSIEYTIPEDFFTYNINCRNNIFQLNDSISLVSNFENIQLFFIPNFYELEYYNIYSEKNLSLLVSNYIDDIVYNGSKYIDIYSNQYKYELGDSINIYFKLNNNIDIDNIYVDFFDENNKILKRLNKYRFVEDGLFLFTDKVSFEGQSYIQGFLNNDQKYNSNVLVFTFESINPEIGDIYLNDKFLSQLAIKSDGIFNKYDKLDIFLDNIKFEEDKSIYYTRKNVIGISFLLVLLVLLLSLEWYYRNKYGLV